MNRRELSFLTLPALVAVLLLAQQRAHALLMGDFTNLEAAQGLRAALEKGALAAVDELGKADGFLGNEKVRIALPGYLEDASKLLRILGQSARVDDLVTAMNRAAEAAMPFARDLLVGAVRSMKVTDARKILTGGETSVTSFFADKSRTALGLRFLPVVSKTTAKVGLADKYNQLAGKAAEMGFIKREDASIQQYVTGKSLDGLFWMIGEEEKKIRRDPVAAGSSVLRKVFGSLK
jgi:hypothetical protein